MKKRPKVRVERSQSFRMNQTGHNIDPVYIFLDTLTYREKRFIALLLSFPLSLSPALFPVFHSFPLLSLPSHYLTPGNSQTRNLESVNELKIEHLVELIKIEIEGRKKILFKLSERNGKDR